MTANFWLSILVQANVLLLTFCSDMDATQVANFTNEACANGGVKPSEPLLFICEVYGVVLRVVLPTGDQEIISIGDTTADVCLPTGFTAMSLNITEIDESTRNIILRLSIASASLLNGGEIKCDDTTPRNEAKAKCPITEATPVATFTNEACANGGVKPSEPLLFTCEVYGVVLLRVVLPTGDQEIISVGDTAADVALPAGVTAVSLDITEIDESTRNFELTLSIDSASLLNDGEIKCDDTTSRNEAKAKCPITVTEATPMATFTNEACANGGVKPSEPLLFTCEVYRVVLLRVVLPTGDQEIISVGDTAADVALPAGFTAVSLDITEIDESTRNFELTLSIDSASLLNDGEIKCDDTTSRNEAKAKCPITEATPMATFTNEACANGGVKPSEPLLFTCEAYGVVLLRVVLPTGDQEIISVGDTAADVALPAGFTAVSLDITEIDESTRNFELTLSIDSASLLNDGEIKCDDTTSRNEAKAKCPITDTSAIIMAYFTNESCVTGGVRPSDPLLFKCKVYGVVLLRVVLPTGDQQNISVGDTADDVDLPVGFTAESLDITEIDNSTRNFSLALFIDSASRLEGGNITCDDTTPRNVAEAGCPIVTSAPAVAYFTNEACVTGGVRPSDPLLFKCKVYGVILLRVVLLTGDQEIISVGDTADDVGLPVGFTAESLDITEIDNSTRNFSLALSIDSASRLEGGNITCDDTTPRNVAEAGCPIVTSAPAVAYFTNEACVAGGVKPSDPLLFTCKVYGVVLLRVVLPTGDQEIISVGDTAADVALPSGYNAMSLGITEIDDSTRNFHLTLSIDRASRLAGGEITCDDTTSRKQAKAGCSVIYAVAHFSNNTCTPDGANPADPLLFTCKVYEVVLLRVVLPTGDQEIISVGDTATDVALPDGFTVESLDIKEIDDFSRNFTLTLFITNASLLNDGGIMCDDTTTKKQAMAGCPTGPLKLTFINDTPYVSEYNLRAEFAANSKVVIITCRIPSLGTNESDCSSGTFSRTFTEDEMWKQNTEEYVLYVTAIHQYTGENVTLRGAFRVFGHQEKYFCSLNVINMGTSSLLQGSSLEFIRVGEAANFTCKIDEEPMKPCGEFVRSINDSEIYSITNLTSGNYRLIVKPTAGCPYRVCYKEMNHTLTVED